MIITNDLPPSPYPKSPTEPRRLETRPISRNSDDQDEDEAFLPPPTYTDSCGPQVITQFAWAPFVKACLWVLSTFVCVGYVLQRVQISSIIGYRWTGVVPKPTRADGDIVSCDLHAQHMGLSGVDIPWASQTFLSNDTRQFKSPPVTALAGSYVSRTEFTLPAFAPSYYFFSRGQLSSGGAFRIRAARLEDNTGDDTIHGTVLTHYSTSQAVGQINMCTLKKDDGSHGFGIFAASSWPKQSDDIVSVEITLTVPFRENSTQSSVLHSDLQEFFHEIGDSKTPISFKEVHVKTLKRHVSLRSLTSEIVNIEANNGQVTGSMHVDRSARITTSNALLDLQITATSNDEKNPTELFFKTSNAPLTANITLTSAKTDDPKFNPSLKTTAMTANSPLDVAVFDAPLHSYLQVDCATSNSAGKLLLPRVFEGTITTNPEQFALSIAEGQEEDEDPSGQGRRRIFEHARRKSGLLDVKILWVPDDSHDQSSASLRASNGNAFVRLL